MKNRPMQLFVFTAVALAALLLPATASAQGGSVWDVLRDRARRERDDDYRRDRGRGRDDGYYRRGRSGRISDYDRRILRDTARRIERRSGDFQKNVDRALDRSRRNGTRYEDHLNREVKQFRDAAKRFESRAGDSNDLNRSVGEARRLLDIAAQLDGQLRRVRLDSRASSDWAEIRRDLRTVADFYGFRFDDGYYGRGRDGWRYPFQD